MVVLEIKEQKEGTSWETQWPSWWIHLITSLVNQLGGWNAWQAVYAEQLDLINEALKPYNGKYVDTNHLTFETEQDKLFFILKYT